MPVRALAALLLVLCAFVPNSAHAAPPRAGQTFVPATAGMPALSSAQMHFVTDMSVAYGVFRHWVLLPYQHGYFAPNQPHHMARLAAAGVALDRTGPALRAAIALARMEPRLRPLLTPVLALANGFNAVAVTLRSGVCSAIGMSSTIGLALATERLQRHIGLPVLETNPVSGSAF